MLNGILFNDKRFKKEDYNNLMSDITENTIILCANSNIMHNLAEEIINTVNGKAEHNDYHCEDEDIGQAKTTMCFRLQHAVKINNQIITLSIEPAIIYKAEKPEDIWFIDHTGSDENYQEMVYPMLVFKGSREVWNKGKDEVYKMIVNGRYGVV